MEKELAHRQCRTRVTYVSSTSLGPFKRTSRLYSSIGLSLEEISAALLGGAGAGSKVIEGEGMRTE